MSAELISEAQNQAHWRTALQQNPDVMIRIIRDLAKVMQSGDRTGRTGRRPSPKAVSFDKLWGMLFPERFTNEPFNVALAEVMEGQSQHKFASKIPIAQPHLSRLLSGKQVPTIEVMEGAARAADISPSYFAEWRAMKLGQLLTDVLLEDPDRSTELVKRLAAIK